MTKPFDGYLGHILRLKDGRSVRILGDAGDEWKATHKINVEFQCYHSDIDHVWSEN